MIFAQEREKYMQPENLPKVDAGSIMPEFESQKNAPK